jgi:hypothetical protein
MDQEGRIVDEVSDVLTDLQRASMPDLQRAIDRVEAGITTSAMIRPHLEALAAEVWAVFTQEAGHKLVERLHADNTNGASARCPECGAMKLQVSARGVHCSRCNFHEQR